MTSFEKHMNIELSEQTMSFLENTSIEELKKKSKTLAFQSKCPVAMVDDTPELREELMNASKMIESFIKFTNQ